MWNKTLENCAIINMNNSTIAYNNILIIQFILTFDKNDEGWYYNTSLLFYFI